MHQQQMQQMCQQQMQQQQMCQQQMQQQQMHQMQQIYNNNNNNNFNAMNNNVNSMLNMGTFPMLNYNFNNMNNTNQMLYNNTMNNQMNYLGFNNNLMSYKNNNNFDMAKYDNNKMNNYIMNKYNENIFPSQRDFNILELYIKNYEKEENIKKALIKFLEAFRNQIKNKFTRVDFINKETLSFNINGFIPPINYEDYDEIIFLDEKYEKLGKFGIIYLIKVKLIQNLTDKYYMVFEGVNIDKEYFYRYIQDFKNIIKILLKDKILL